MNKPIILFAAATLFFACDFVYGQSQTFHTGSVVVSDGNGHSVTIQSPNSGNTTFVPPSNSPNNGDVVTSNGAGGTTWQAPGAASGGIPSGSTIITTSDVPMSGFTLIDSTQIYGATWATATSAPTARISMASCTLNGSIYVIGGFTGGTYQNRVEIFDPVSQNWSNPLPTTPMTARADLATVTVNGRIYALGGFDGSHELSTLEIYDPTLNAWVTPVMTGHMTARRDLAACVVNGIIYALGGQIGFAAVNTCETFNPATNTWSTPAEFGSMAPRAYFQCIAVGNQIYAMGGLAQNLTTYLGTLDILNTTSNIWSTPVTTGFMIARDNFGAAVINNEIYIMGGYAGGIGPNTSLSNLQEFDPPSLTWSTPFVAGAMTPRFELTASAANGKIYVIGGFDGSSYLSTNESFTPALEEYFFTKN